MSDGTDLPWRVTIALDATDIKPGADRNAEKIQAMVSNAVTSVVAFSLESGRRAGMRDTSIMAQACRAVIMHSARMAVGLGVPVGVFADWMRDAYLAVEADSEAAEEKGPGE
jgi:hypothetical protein